MYLLTIYVILSLYYFFAKGQIMQEFWQENWGKIVNYLPTLGAALVVLVGGHFLIKLINRLVGKALNKTRLDASIHRFILVALRIALRVLLFIVVLDILKIPTGPFITALGAAGLAVSLAVKDNISALAGGVIILFSKPFVAGDYIEVEDEAGGVVDYIDLLYTRLHTYDNKIIQIPNNTMSNARITNFSAMEKRRLDITFSIGYGEDFRQAETLILDVVRAHKKVLPDPAPVVRLNEHGPSALGIITRVWVKTEDYWDVRFDLLEGVKDAFDAAHIEIPYNQLDVHIQKAGEEIPPETDSEK